MTDNRIKTIVELDSTQAQASIIKLGATASDTTKTLEERIAAKNKQIEIQNELSQKTVDSLEKEKKALEKRGASEKELSSISEKLNKAKIEAVKTNESGTVSVNKLQAAQEKLSISTAKQNTAYALLNKDRLEAKKTLMDLVAAEGLGTEAVIKAQAAFDVLDKKTKEADHSAKDFTKSVGDYPTHTEKAYLGLTSLSGAFGDNVRKMSSFVQGGKAIFDSISKQNDKTIDYVKNLFTFSSATEVATVSEEALNIAVASSAVNLEASAVASVEAGVGAEVMAGGFSLASAGTWLLNTALGVLLSPITLVVVAAGLLYSVFKDYAPLINPIKDAFTALGAVFGTVKTAIFDLVTGARSFSDIFSSITGDMKDAAKEAYNLGKATRDLAKAQDIQEVSSARNSTLIQKLLLQSKDLSKSTEERVALIDRAQKLEEEDYKITKKNNDEAIRIAKIKLFEGKKLSDAEEQAIMKNDFSSIRSMKLKKQLDTETLNSYKDLLIKREDLSKTDIQIQEKAQNRKNKLLEKAADKADKDAEDAEKRRQDRDKEAEEERKRMLKNQLDLLTDEIQAKRQKNTSSLALEIEYLNKKNEIDIQATGLNKSELLSIENKHQMAIEEVKKTYSEKAKAEANKKLTDQIALDQLEINNRRAHGENTLALELELLEKKKIQDLTYVAKTEEEKAAILEKAKQESDALKEEDKIAQLENTLSNDELILEQKKANGESTYAQEKQLRDDALAIELADLSTSEDEKKRIKERARLADAEAKKVQIDSDLNAAAEMFGIQKELSIAKMIMNAPEAIGNSFTTAAKVYPAPLSLAMGALGAAGVVVPIIKGLSDIKKARFPGSKKGSGGGGAGASMSSSGISSGVSSGAVSDIAANNAARLGIDPALGSNATSKAASNVAGGTSMGVVFSESKYNDFKQQVAFKETKTTI